MWWIVLLRQWWDLMHGNQLNNDKAPRVAIIGTRGVPAQYGGFETLAENLVRNFKEPISIIVYCSSKRLEEKPTTYRNAKLVYLNLRANGFQSIPYDIVSIVHALRHSDILLIMGVSGALALPILKPWLRKKRVIINVDGLEWKRRKWGSLASRYLRFSEKLAVKYGDVIVADNQCIVEHVHAAYAKKAVLIPYGGDHAQQESLDHSDIKKWFFLEEIYYFSVCRIEPENNIHTILDAFADMPRYPLVIVGNWDGSEYGRRLKNSFDSYMHIYLLDPIYELRTLNKLRSNCRCYIHGHSAGGTNPSLVEAMYLGLPVVAYDVMFNKHTTAFKAEYFKSPETLKELINNLSSERLGSIGMELQKVAYDKYTWRKIVLLYEQLFNF